MSKKLFAALTVSLVGVAPAAVTAHALTLTVPRVAPTAGTPFGAEGSPAVPAGQKQCGDAGANYETASPEQVGLDQKKLNDALDYWTSHGSETVKVFKNNCLVGEGRLDPVYNYKPIWIASHTKTTVMLALGRAQTLGYLNVNDPIGKYLPQGLGDPAHRAITIRQLITMTSGLHMNWTREVNHELIPDRVREALSLGFDFQPGTHMWYQQTPCWLVPAVLTMATGMDFQDFLQKQVFDPLGIPQSHWFWTRDRSGNSDGPGWKVFEDAVDFGREGQLLLHNGMFRGRQLIDPGFLADARTGTAANPGYGYFMWLNSANHWVNGSLFKREEHDSPGLIVSAPRDMYMSWGYRGQHVFVIPSLDMVVTRTGETTPDQWGTAPAADPGWAMTMGEQKQGYYDFFKTLMESVKDRPMPAPPPFSAQPTLPLDDIEMGDFVNPQDNAAVLSLGPVAPQGCAAAGCNGQLAYEGTRTWMTDSLRTGPETAAGTSKGLSSGFAPRTLRTGSTRTTW
jgi:CubicO group peptidase (beta-lactamase class C family)